MRKTPAWQPEQPLPTYADKATAAAIITHHFFPISPRTLERWPLTVRRPNKATIYDLRSTIYDLRSTIYDLRSR